MKAARNASRFLGREACLLLFFKGTDCWLSARKPSSDSEHAHCRPSSRSRIRLGTYARPRSFRSKSPQPQFGLSVTKVVLPSRSHAGRGACRVNSIPALNENVGQKLSVALSNFWACFWMKGKQIRTWQAFLWITICFPNISNCASRLIFSPGFLITPVYTSGSRTYQYLNFS